MAQLPTTTWPPAALVTLFSKNGTETVVNITAVLIADGNELTHSLNITGGIGRLATESGVVEYYQGRSDAGAAYVFLGLMVVVITFISIAGLCQRRDKEKERRKRVRLNMDGNIGRSSPHR